MRNDWFRQRPSTTCYEGRKVTPEEKALLEARMFEKHNAYKRNRQFCFNSKSVVHGQV